METLTQSDSRRHREERTQPFLAKMHRCWTQFRQYFGLVTICRFSSLFAFAIPAVFIWNEQASEVLRCLAEGHAEGGAAGRRQFFSFYIALLTFSMYVWYSSRVLLYFRYPDMHRDTEATLTFREWLPRILGVVPPVGMAIAFRLSAAPYGEEEATRKILWWYPGLCLGMGLALMIFFLKRHQWFSRGAGESSRKRPVGRLPKDLERWTWIAIAFVWAMAALLFILFLVGPVAVPRLLGTGAVILFAAATWVCMGSVLVYCGSRWQVPLLGAALVCAAIFSRWNDNHQIRTLPTKTELKEKLLLTHLGERYDGLTNRFVNSPAGARRAVFLVAAEGGGIRAAYWTASVLAAIQEANTNFAAHVFGISGVSGGSLGAVVFNGLVACNRGELLKDAQAILSEDHLSPTIAYMVLPDLLQRFIPFPIAKLDRAQALEMAWEAAWKNHCKSDAFDKSFLELWQMRADLPDLYLNGTSVEFGKRIITSNVRFHTNDFVDVLSAYEKLDGDLRLSTAAHMSARFTYVSPAGEFPGPAKDHIVDGGYFENSGAATAKELADVIAEARPEADIYVIQISNSPTEISEKKDTVKRHEFLGESLAPVHTLLHTRTARGSYSELVMSSSPVVKRPFLFKLEAGPVPLPLGWQLSRKAAAEMTRQLRLPKHQEWISEIANLLPKS